MKILMTGGTGTIGKSLGKELSDLGHDLFVVSRSKKNAYEDLPFYCEIIEADLTEAPLALSFTPDLVIHLMGESIDGRWSDAKKKRIEVSRIQATENLCASLKDWKGTFLSVSAIGFYGDRGDEELTEESAAGKGYLSSVCQRWEKASESLSSNSRRVILRMGVVLDPFRGALPKMLFPFKSGLGGSLGDGKQYMSWIHIQDAVNAFLYVIQNEKAKGVYNVVAPQPVTNREFTKSLAHRVQRSTFFPVPTLGLKTVLGEMSCLVLDSAKAFPKKLQQEGFQFGFPKLEEAFNHLLKDQESTHEVFFAEQFIPYPKEKIFHFFGEAENLEVITPGTLSFSIQYVSTEKIQKGTLIDYRLKIHGVPVKWKTLIEEWEPYTHFVDSQAKGPYHFWRHTHSFRNVRGGTLMTDRVRYQLPLSYLGWVGGIHFVKRDVENIFAYRRKVIAALKF